MTAEMARTMERPALVEARDIVKCYRSKGLFRPTGDMRALDGVDFTIRHGEIVALIGESGSGKTTLGKVILRLTPLDEGQVVFDGVDIYQLERNALRQHRRAFQMVFQNQAANLHPNMTITQMVDESLRLHQPDMNEESRNRRAEELLERVGLTDRVDQRPSSLSGGERRRVGLARILATRPRFIVADEPTSGLDAAIKLQIIDLLKSLKDQDLTYLLISHDLGLVRRISERVAVMLKGRIVEHVPVTELRCGGVFHHPYTEKLIGASDLLDERRRPMRDRRSLPHGFNPAALERAAAEPGSGCVYVSHCELAVRLGILDSCLCERPPLVEIGPGHSVACFGSPTREESES